MYSNLVRLGIYSTSNIDVYSTKGMTDDHVAVIGNISAGVHQLLFVMLSRLGRLHSIQSARLEVSCYTITILALSRNGKQE